MINRDRVNAAFRQLGAPRTAIAVTATVAVCTLGLATAAPTHASWLPRSAQQSSAPFVVESYYRIRWGNEDEFMTLFRRNHVPFLRRQLEKGILLEVRLDTPHEHQPEDSRWDLRMTLVYPDAASAYRTDKITDADYAAIVRGDSAEARFNQEERRRFELLAAHWDVNVRRLEVLTR